VCPLGVRCQSGTCRVQCPPGQSLVKGTCTSAREIEAGLFHTCVRHDGGVVCFGGLASTGSLGSGSPDGGRLPQFASGLSDVVSLALSDNSSCALLGTGAVRCWGDNTFGQVGNGATMNAFSPAVTMSENVVSLTAGSVHHCALLVDAGVACWGAGFSGQLGIGSTPMAVRTPTALPHDAGATAVFAGDVATYVRRVDGALRWAGSDRGSFSSTLVPASLTDGGVRQLVLGANHGCLIRLDSSELECWGRGLDGQLGYPVSGAAEQPVRLVPGLGPVSDVCTGKNFTCAVMPDAGVRCFGANGAGQLGAGNFVSTPTPTPTDTLPPARQLACHHDHVCVTTDDGTWCWGDNSQGQLGAPTPVSAPSPLRVSLP
jgi:alpha-tubulin suppressor-like RCC1 family protein